VLLGSSVRKWYWNYRFDVTVLAREFAALRGPHADGLHLHWLIQPECDHHLAFAVQSYLDAPPWKAVFWDKQDAGEATNDDLLDYNANDAIQTIRIVPPLQAEVAKRGNAHLIDHQMKVAELARRAEGYGIPLDPEAWTKLRTEYQAKQQTCLAVMRDEIRKQQLEAELEEHVHKQRVEAAEKRARLSGAEAKEPDRWVVSASDFTPRSKFHARWYLYEHLALPVLRMTAGGADKNKEQQEASTSYKGVLSWLSNPLVKAYVDFSEFDYKLSLLDAVWGKCEIVDGMPRLFVTWNTTGMKGTRWTSKIVNMQNWESVMRVLLRALPGRVWVGADADQIEYRICAALAGIPELLKLFNAPPYDETKEEWKKYDPQYDAHSLVAAIVFGNAYLIADLKTKKKWRTLVKRVVYAMFYGGLPPKILQSLLEDRRLPSELRATLTLERVTMIWQGFKRRFPQWDKWAVQEMDTVRTTGCQDIPPFGQKRWWLLDQLEENKIRNTPIQLAAGHVCNYIFVRIQDRIDAEGLDSQMTIHAHDALCLDTKEEHAPRVAEIVNEEFKLVFPGPAGPVAIRGTAKTGPTVADI
jgi:DNA polymerase I-like protein with 3'-5' exonuclease and polymerase domains